MNDHYYVSESPQTRNAITATAISNNTVTAWLLALVMVLLVTSAQAQISFSDMSAAAGVVHRSETYGASWGDLNGDGYPDIYVSNHRTTDSLFLNKGDGTFIDTGSQVLTWITREHADTHGASFSDFDNDGDQDLLVATGAGQPGQFLVNEHGALVDRTDQFGIGYASVGGRLPLWIDYNGDHLPDFLLTQHTGNTRLFRQVKSTTGNSFVETTTNSKLVCKYVHYGQFFDVDGDGRLDFMCPDESVYPTSIYNTLPWPWQKLFDAAAPSAVFPAVSKVADSIIGDFNNDGRLDVFLLGGVQLRPSSVVQGGASNFEAQLTGGNKGFKFVSTGAVTFTMDWNQADEGTTVSFAKIQIGSSGWSPTALPFTLNPADAKVAGMPPVATTQADLPVMQIGYNPATGLWSLVLQTTLTDSATAGVFSEAYLQVSSAAPITSLQSTGLWATDKAARPTLLMNYAGAYVDDTVAAGLATPVQCVSATAGDFDNDRDVDLYLACRTGASNIQNILYENQGNATFVAVAGAGGAGGPVGLAVASGAGTADSVISADYDVDGFLDLFVTNGLNMRPLYYGGPNKLFRNKGNANHWIEVRLVGTRTERDALGAHIKATANGLTQLRVLDGGYHRWSQEHTPSHFGLATATSVDLRVEWPGGSVETYANVPADKLYRIVEGTGITLVTPGVAPAYPCGAPRVDGAIDVGVFIWKDCTSGSWQVRAAAGGGSSSYSGTVTSSSIYASVTPIGLNEGDALDSSSNPRQIAFTVGAVANASNGFNFVPQLGASSCFKVSAAANTPVFYGPLRVAVATSFDIDTLAKCVPLPPEVSVAPVSAAETAGQVLFTVKLSATSAQTVTVNYASVSGTATAADYTNGSGTLSFAAGTTTKTVAVPILDDALAEGDESFTLKLSNPINTTLTPFANQAAGTIVDNEPSPCGAPIYDAGVSAALFVWRDCTTGQWYSRVSAGGAIKTMTYQGSVTAEAAFTAVQAYSIESADSLNFTTNPAIISFSENVVGANQDGFNFSLPAGANACVRLSGPVGAKVLLGSEMRLITAPFRLDTMGPC